MEVSPVKRISVSEQIFEQLKEKITSGELQPGEKLPSENELCRLYGVSRTTIRQALANLSSLELIETKFGEGSFVKQTNIGDVISSLLNTPRLSKESILEVIEFRQIIEPPVAKLACKKAADRDVKLLRTLYRNMVEHQNDLAAFTKYDREFHLAIARISGNAHIVRIFDIISDVLHSAFDDIVSKRGNSAGIKYHGMILNAFEIRDDYAVYRIMQEHMDDMRSDYESRTKIKPIL